VNARVGMAGAGGVDVKRIAFVVTFAALLGSARLAAALGPLCCACLPVHTAQTSGNNGTTVGALFCAAAPPASFTELNVRCAATPGQELGCFPVIPGTACVAQLASEGVTCPRAGAPVAAPITLLGLAVSLAAVGVLAARRRRRA